MGRPANVALQIMIDLHDLDSSVDELSAETDEVYATVLDTRLETMPGLLELLAALERAEIPKAIATSSGPDFVRTVLGKFDLAPRFYFILTSADVLAQGKPNPEIYLSAAARFGVDPPMLVLEDSQNGCRAAVAAGAITVAVPDGLSRRHDFKGAAPWQIPWPTCGFTSCSAWAERCRDWVGRAAVSADYVPVLRPQERPATGPRVAQAAASLMAAASSDTCQRSRHPSWRS